LQSLFDVLLLRAIDRGRARAEAFDDVLVGDAVMGSQQNLSPSDLACPCLAAAGESFELGLLFVGQFDDLPDVHASSSDGVAGCEIMNRASCRSWSERA